MGEESRSSAGHPRIEIRLRNNGVLEAGVSLRPGQALAPYLVNRRGAINLRDVVSRDTGKYVDHLTLLEHEIVWARPVDGTIPLTNVALTPGGTLPLVTVVLASGQTLQGRFALIRGQGVSDFLGTSGPFPVLRDARLPDDRKLGDVALSLSAIRSVRDLGSAAEAELWERENTAPSPSSPAPGRAADEPVHWLLAMARRAGRGHESLALSPTAPALDVWWALCAAGGMDQDAIAQMIADELRLPLARAVASDAGAESAVPDELGRRFGVRALRDDGRQLVIATIDPLDANAEQALSFACKRRVTFAVATPDWLGLSAVSNDPETELESLLAGIPSLTTDLVRVEEDLDPQNVSAGEVSSEPIIKLANLILREAVRQNASDVHLEPDAGRGLIRFRVDGVLRHYMHVPLPALSRVISRFKILGKLDIADRIRPQDGRVRVRIDGRALELRLSTVPTQDAEKAVIRIAGAVQEQTLDQLEVTAPELVRLRELLGHRDGIIIVTGPTGSGKTTTLYAALAELNTGRVNIMTVEDPVERALPGATQIQVQPKRGVTFASSLRAVLRQDPDVILIGEIRDLETAEIAVQAAMTGHLVLTTLHTTSAVGVVERLRDLGLDRASLAASLRGVVAQRLARRLCADCDGDGCPRCDDSGYRGRIPVMEVLTATPDLAELIGHGAPFHELQRVALAQGMRPIADVAEQRVTDGLTTAAEIRRVIGDAPADVRRMAGDTHVIGDARAENRTVHATRFEDVIDAELIVEPGEYVASDSATPPIAQVPARRVHDDMHRGGSIRSLLQGLDRCVAERLRIDEVLQFACSGIATAFDSPLVWAATPNAGELKIRARAGSCAPWLEEVVPDHADLMGEDAAVGTAIRTAAPQGRHIAQSESDPAWRERARLHGLPIFLAVPMGEGVIGLHARGMDGLDQQSGIELVNVVDRVAAVVQRLDQLHAAGMRMSAFECAVDAVFTTDRQGTIQWVNRSFTELSGYSTSEIVGRHVRVLRSEKHDAEFYGKLWSTVLAGRAWRGELVNMKRDGGTFVVEQTITPITDEHGSITHFLVVQRDIAERKQREESVQQMVSLDALTRLPNSRALHVEIERRITATAAGGADAALLLIQIDGASAQRDTLGPAFADDRVVRIAAALSQTLRPGDFLARLGDDELAALLPDTPLSGAAVVVNRINDAIAHWSFDDTQPDVPHPTVSIGIAPIDGTDGARAVLAMADAALYGARERRDGRVVLYSSGAPPEHGGDSEEWARRIREALDDEHFVLHFQPVVRLESGAVSHHDALIRMHDDDGNVIPARAFIAHAESLGLMPRIDEWVLENVLRMLRVAPGMRVSMNLGAATVMSPAFRQFVQGQSRRMSTVGARIIFEVAEVAAARDLPRMLANMQRLGELGCRFALDNFGIGASSLASLGALPVDYVKLDGSLIRGIENDEARADIVRALATVARALGKEVIAGCAETHATVSMLPSLGIELAQGHCLGRPLPELAREGAAQSRRLRAADEVSWTHPPLPAARLERIVA